MGLLSVFFCALGYGSCGDLVCGFGVEGLGLDLDLRCLYLVASGGVDRFWRAKDLCFRLRKILQYTVYTYTMQFESSKPCQKNEFTFFFSNLWTTVRYWLLKTLRFYICKIKYYIIKRHQTKLKLYFIFVCKCYGLL